MGSGHLADLADLADLALAVAQREDDGHPDALHDRLEGDVPGEVWHPPLSLVCAVPSFLPPMCP